MFAPAIFGGISLFALSKPMPRSLRKFHTFSSTMNSGRFAIHFAITMVCCTPLCHGKSTKNGGFLGFGDQAAALANAAFVAMSALAKSSNVFTPSIVAADAASGGTPKSGERQHGFKA